ncbi:MAG: hypothetical protein C0391_03765 [Anaerolinea sp.]|nr:hypothetical protein [Anaerolinea sp.]
MKNNSTTQLIEYSKLAEWHKVFAAWLYDGSRSESTVLCYFFDLGVYARWFAEENEMEFSPDQLTAVDLRAFRTWSLTVQKCRPSTWNRRRVSLKAISKWAFDAELVQVDVARGLKEADEIEQPLHWLVEKEYRAYSRKLEQLVNSSHSTAGRRQAIRDKAMILLMLEAGLRESEVVGLKGEDITLGERSGKVRVFGKREKTRFVPLNTELREALSCWIELNKDADPKSPFFSSKQGEQITAHGLQRRVGLIGVMCGFKVTPHMLRHTFAKRMLNSGTGLEKIASLLGHSDLNTTIRYTKPGWDELEQAVEKI